MGACRPTIDLAAAGSCLLQGLLELAGRYRLGGLVDGRELSCEAVQRQFEQVALTEAAAGTISGGLRSRTTSASAASSPELIFARYSCARLAHMSRLIRGLPFRIASTSASSFSPASFRRPAARA